MVESDEIDLIEVVKNVIRFFKKSKFYILTFIAIGAILGFLYNWQKKPIYTAKITVASAYLKKSDFNIIIQKLNNQIQYKDYKNLTEQLNLDSALISQINKFEIIEKDDKEVNESALKEFIINMSVHDNSIIDTMNESLYNYIKNSEILKLKSQTTIAKYTKLSSKIDEEIAQLELLKIKTISLLNNESKFFISNFGSINETVVKLYEQNLILKERLEQNVDFMILEKFNIPNLPSNKNALKFSLIGAFAFAFLGIVFLASYNFIKSIS